MDTERQENDPEDDKIQEEPTVVSNAKRVPDRRLVYLIVTSSYSLV